MEGNNAKKIRIEPEVYYNNLSRKEKTMFLDYMFVKYDIRQETLRSKIRNYGSQKLSPMEKKTVCDEIETENWRKKY